MKATEREISEDQLARAVSAVDEIMEQAQVFASGWSLVGGIFDDGSLLESAEEEKTKLRVMVVALARKAAIEGTKP